jgi:3'-5' exoribonuclease
MKTIYTNSLNNGSEFQEAFMVADMRVLKTKKDTDYALFKLVDKTGSIDAKMWDYNASAHSDLKSGAILTIVGKVESYAGKLQVVVSSFVPNPPCNLNDFVKATKYDIQGMWNNLTNRVANISDHNIKVVAEDLLLHGGWGELFRKCPAATGMHHAFVGGLLEHTEQMVRMSDALFDLSFFATELNKDLCTFGVMFHDFGKIFEYSPDAGFKKIESGILVGHISMVSAMIYESCNKHGVPDEIRNHMMHVILAHHGKVEWGSPVSMATPEAIFVHHVDHLHGDVMGVLQRIEDNPGQDFVKHSYDMGNIVTRRFKDEQQTGF